METSRPDYSVLSRIFLCLLGVAFLGLTALRIHGSSVVMWSVTLNEQATSKALLYSMPRAVRSDEWLVETPSVLAQARHDPPFPVENPTLGAGRSPMLMNLPTRHYSTWFRPQMWGYFLGDVEQGFAWNWNAKIFGLLAAMFLLVRKLSGGNFWLGVLGSAWVYASSYTQWWFSCPPMLPEMMASWALALWCVIRLAEGPRWPRALPLTAGLIVVTVNFALSMYPPYQLPLAYLGGAILAGWFWQGHAENAFPRKWAPIAGWLTVAGVGVALVIIPFFRELMPTLELVRNTSYPGARRTTGGALGAVNLLLGLAEPFLSADLFPEKRGTICGAANFYPLWLAAAGWMAASWRGKRNPGARLLWPILGCILVFTVFAVCPLPALFGRVTLLSFTTEERLILPIGLGGVLLSVLVLRDLNTDPAPSRGRKLTLLAVCAGAAIAVLLSAAAESPKFFTAWRLTGAIAFSLAIFTLYLWSMKRTFAALLFVALVPPAIRVNPISRGLSPLTESTACAAIDEIRRADPEARWLAFDRANQSAFLMSAGVNVLSGAKTLPDLAFYRELDPTGANLEIYNRYSLGLFHLAPSPEMVRFRLFDFCAHDVLIHPLHPALRARAVRYFVFPQPLADPALSGLKEIKSLPEREMWVYGLAEG